MIFAFITQSFLICSRTIFLHFFCYLPISNMAAPMVSNQQTIYVVILLSLYFLANDIKTTKVCVSINIHS